VNREQRFADSIARSARYSLIHAASLCARGPLSLVDCESAVAHIGINVTSVPVQIDTLAHLRDLTEAGLLTETKSAVDLLPRWSLTPGVLERACIRGLSALVDDTMTGEV
jgi:hypothetical protein